MDQQLKNALISLKGLSIGDALGEQFFGNESLILPLIKKKELPNAPWEYTDDTKMAISIVDTLINFGKINQDYLINKFVESFENEPFRGYGPGAIRLLSNIRNEGDWRSVSKQAFNGEGSFGNGAAMRVAPLGAYFSGNTKRVIENAMLSAEVTHAHPEGIAGAIAVALAASYSASLGDSKLVKKDFFEFIIDNMPACLTKSKIIKAEKISFTLPTTEVVSKIGAGENVSAMDTVPYILWNVAKNIDNYEKAFWNTVSGLGDRDTTCAMVCGIVALSTKTPVPEEWIKNTEKLPEEFEVMKTQ